MASKLNFAFAENVLESEREMFSEGIAPTPATTPSNRNNSQNHLKI